MINASSLDDFRDLIANLPGPDDNAIALAAQREEALTKPAGSLGRLETLVQWLCAWQGCHPPSANLCRAAIFASSHGVTKEGVSAYPAEVTHQMVLNFEAGGAAINQLCAQAGCTLSVYPIEIDRPTQSFLEAPAMTEEECADAMRAGADAAEEGLDILCLGEMGIGNTTAAAAICHGLYGGKPDDWVGPGTGVKGQTLDTKIRVVRDGIVRHRDHLDDGLEVLRHVGGREIAAMAGAIVAARHRRIPVILDGYVCCAAASTLYAMSPSVLDHCIVGHLSAEPGHRRLLDRLEKRPVVDLDMRLGEGSGAVVALQVVQAAVACHNQMATFETAGVSNKG